jgi:DNA-binding NarL/FixJ family response regulator
VNIKQEYKVFLVDDHPLVLEGITRLINREDDLVVCGIANDVPNAVKLIAECEPDIVIVDIALKDSDGFTLIEALQDSHADLPILVFSVHEETVYAEQCIRAGAKGYIIKREPCGKFILAIREILKGSIYVSGKLENSFFSKIHGDIIKYNNSPVEILSPRQLEVYKFYGQGLRNSDIANELNLSVKTIETYVENIKKKMNFSSPHEIVMHAMHFIRMENDTT